MEEFDFVENMNFFLISVKNGSEMNICREIIEFCVFDCQFGISMMIASSMMP